MDRIYLDIIVAIANLSTLLPVVILGLNLNHQPYNLRWLMILLSFSLLETLISLVLYTNGINPNYALSVFEFFSLSIYSCFFYYTLKWRRLKNALLAVNIICCLFAIVNFLFIQEKFVNGYNRTLQSLIIILFSLIFFYKLLKELPSQQLQKLPVFWIVSGIFFSHAGQLSISATTNYLIQVANDNMIVGWMIHYSLTIIANILIAYGVWVNYKQLKNSSVSQ
jgi:hypothetical protein